MNSNPLVSICIPAYNSERWIESTIKSALAQTWKNKEIIIVDDGSTDNTYKIAKQFESNILKVYNQRNSGACVARNKALSLASGDFFQWLDSDDLLAPDKIENQIINSDYNSHSSVLHSSAFGQFLYRIRSAKFVPTPLWKDLSPMEWLLEHFNNGHWMYTAAWLVSRKLTESAGLWDERLSRNQDGEYFTRVVAVSQKVKFHSDAKSYYRKANFSSITSNKFNNALQSIILSKNLQADSLLKLENSERTKKACVNSLLREMFRYNLNDELIAKVQKRISELGGVVTSPKYTRKFEIVEKFLGVKRAKKIKGRIWYFEKLLNKFWEKFCSILFRDET
jgi:glycosyltransferase involved in cell wall biosynthesis